MIPSLVESPRPLKNSTRISLDSTRGNGFSFGLDKAVSPCFGYI